METLWRCGVYDPLQRSNHWAHMDECCAWLERAGLDPGQIVNVRLVMIDMPAIEVEEYTELPHSPRTACRVVPMVPGDWPPGFVFTDTTR